jgi:hypothetical protein
VRWTSMNARTIHVLMASVLTRSTTTSASAKCRFLENDVIWSLTHVYRIPARTELSVYRPMITWTSPVTVHVDILVCNEIW